MQVTYDPGWVATANGRPVVVTRDGIGLITLHPLCDGRCEIELSFDGGAQRRICLELSAFVMFGVAAVSALGIQTSESPPNSFRYRCLAPPDNPGCGIAALVLFCLWYVLPDTPDTVLP